MSQLQIIIEINRLKTLRNLLWKGNKQRRRAELQRQIDLLEACKEA